MADYWSYLRCRQGVPVFKSLVRNEPLNSLQNLAPRKLETPFYGVMQSIFRDLEPFRRESRV